ncbi:Uncharacterized protein FWK35_00009806 [Aphis craccivora]|uniref:Uncharacterized protein n=1 Tax=Aphis craccivora TaxID=307492 RepID=A0A6G0YUE5_APHCR|nr:Uncharacterized protein FWK35_00009806 [Aphis craccivora]
MIRFIQPPFRMDCHLTFSMTSFYFQSLGLDSVLNLNNVGREFDIFSFTHSERSDECIDFTMICFFFVSVYIINSRNNAPISNFEGGFRCKSEYPWCIIEVKSKHFPTVFKKIKKNKKKKNDGKKGIFTQNQFSTKSIFLYGCNSKTNHCKHLKFSPNIYISSNFQKLLTFFDVDWMVFLDWILDDQNVLKI